MLSSFEFDNSLEKMSLIFLSLIVSLLKDILLVIL